jgi:GNAT superfamily N-acetyltransferase
MSAVADLWNGFYPPKYAVDANLLAQQLLGSVLLDREASVASLSFDGKVDHAVAFKDSATPRLYGGGDPVCAHLSMIAYSHEGSGFDLLRRGLAMLRRRGVERVVFGQDVNHVFPGVPMECGRLIGALEKLGFECGGLTYDLERDLHDYEPPPSAAEALHREGVEVRAFRPGEVPALRRLLEREFPGRWVYDTLTKVETEWDPSIVVGLFVGGSPEGFALTQRHGCRAPINGGVWHVDLGLDWGALGAIGVSERVRGQRLGGALLAGALCCLRDSGVRRCIIDWTGLTDFYGLHGFAVTRTYASYCLTL